jgi:hypothetical protein
MLIADFLFAHYLEKGEKILEVFHRHPFIMLPDLLRIGFFGFGIPLFLFYLFPDFLIFFALWMFVSLIRLIYVLFDWYHDVILATNVSLISVIWDGFFDRSSGRLEYNQIDGSKSEIRGFTRTIFNYGELTVTHGSGLPLVLKDAISPKRAEKRIMMYQEKFVNDQNLKDSDTLKVLLSSMLKHHAKTQSVPERE